MKIKQTLLVLAVTLGAVVLAAPIALAQGECAGVDTAIVSCEQKGGSGADVEDSGVWGLLLIALNIMTAGVGIAAVGGIVWGAILYSSASDSAEQVKKAKNIFRDVAIGLIAYGFMYLLLNFLIPGGIFS